MTRAGCTAAHGKTGRPIRGYRSKNNDLSGALQERHDRRQARAVRAVSDHMRRDSVRRGGSAAAPDEKSGPGRPFHGAGRERQLGEPQRFQGQGRVAQFLGYLVQTLH